MHHQVKLVGSYINAPPDHCPEALNLAPTADARVRRAVERLPRVGRLPEGT